MFNFIKEQLAIWRFKKSLRAYTRPDRAFLKSTRTRFITLTQQRAGVCIRAKHPRSWKYATVAIVAVLSMTSGMAVFADANNVPVKHPLYNLKRVSEQVRLNLSSPVQQVELHRVFAHRRLEEVTELELETDINNRPIPPQSKIRVNNKIQIDKLSKDFENEIRPEFCKYILDTIKNRPDKVKNRMIDRVKIRCHD